MKRRQTRPRGMLAWVVVTYILALMSLAALCLIFVYTITYLFIDNSITASSFVLLNVSQVLILAILFLPLRTFFDRLLRKVLFVRSYDSTKFFAQLNRTLLSTTDLRLLLKNVSKDIATTFQSRQVFFFIYHLNDHYISAGTDRHSELSRQETTDINKWIITHPGNVLAITGLKKDDSMYRLMISHKIEMIIPLRRSNQLIGYLCLGATIHGMRYTIRDHGVIETISDELVIAIQNALSVQEVRELNATLQQRINSATRELRSSNTQLQRLDKAKDEFVSMASHQLRTPLTSIKGYISMVLEGDAGKITDSQAHFLGEAFSSSERMVHLINDFLNVSRLQTGKFLVDKRPVNLEKVVEQELDSLKTTATSRGLSFSYKMPKDFPLLNLDEDKMRQVIMNFCDNAIYYSAEETKIKVTLAVEGKDAVFKVTDTGIGVPRTEQSQLFSKFYRASNARKQRPDGTGVGLYLAKKVIDAHKGKVIFESAEGKGSIFGFSLPIEELRVRSDADNLDNQDNNG